MCTSGLLVSYPEGKDDGRGNVDLRSSKKGQSKNEADAVVPPLTSRGTQVDCFRILCVDTTKAS